MSFTSTDPQSHKGKTNTWLTPLPLIKALGEFDLDPCAYPGHITARTRWHGEPQTDGLSQLWFGRVWLNPPYGKETAIWLDKLNRHGNGIALVFSRIETKWLQPFLFGGFFALQGRIKFLQADFSESSNAGVGSILIPFGTQNKGAILSSNLKGMWLQ